MRHINFARRTIESYQFHFDHSTWTLIYPINIELNTVGFTYHNYYYPKNLAPIILRLINKFDYQPKNIKKIYDKDNTAILIKGRNILHSSPITEENIKRELLVLHI